MWVIFALLDPDPGTPLKSRSNPDPDLQHGYLESGALAVEPGGEALEVRHLPEVVLVQVLPQVRALHECLYEVQSLVYLVRLNIRNVIIQAVPYLVQGKDLPMLPEEKSYSTRRVYHIKSNQIKSNQIKSNQIKSNQIKSNQIKSNQIKSNQIKIISKLVLTYIYVHRT